jgi:N-methylhydantoinase A
MRIGVDAGGTFTDFAVSGDDGRLRIFKLRSAPRNPAPVILEGLRRAGGQASEIVHGSTVATNALLERKGVRTGFVTTAGFEDMIEIGRQNRAELYNLTPAPRRLLVPAELRFGVHERTYHDGRIARRPATAELERLRRKLEGAGVEAVAICLLHSYQNAANEQRVAHMLRATGYVCASHEVCPEFREYERASTTVLNAYVGPLMAAYLAELTRCGAPVAILQSSGGFMTAAEACRQPVRTILSGPAGGVVGALFMARQSGFERLLTFDMGGTSTDVSLAEGKPRQTTEGRIEDFPIRVPMLDIHTVGAGGGSIARVDEGGLLRVGPESAGADPGPACYGVGELPTVTDAHVVLGRIAAEQFLSGEIRIEAARSVRAVERLARQLGLRLTEAAEGILRVANANMQRAIRVVSVERGYDPRDFALVAFGGCGGLHACELAEALGMRTVLVPRYAEALSAVGMLVADRVRDYASTVLGRTDYEERFAELERRAREELPGARLERLADLRYAGQSYELTVPWNARNPTARFHRAHRREYGYATPERPVEIVTIRLRATLPAAKPKLEPLPHAEARPQVIRRVHVAGKWRQVAVYRREQAPRRMTAGPAVVLDYGATTLVPPGWVFQADEVGNLILTAR